MRRLLVIGLVLLAGIASTALSTSAWSHWTPASATSWQVQFSGRIDQSVAADVFDLDMFDTPARSVERLHASGRDVVCYINAGAWEDWRPDADRYPASVKGRQLTGWPGERWLDVRRLDVLRPILAARLDHCRAKGFDGVDFDNVDGYTNDTGFDLSRADQLAFDRWLARAAHRRGLAVGLKNALELAGALQPDFDFAVLEQCHVYHECSMAAPFLAAGKAVLDIEYDVARPDFCPEAATLGIVAMLKHLSLDAWRRACP